MAQAIKRTNRKAPLTVGSMLPKIAGGIAATAVLWAVFAAANTADRATQEAAQTGGISNVRAALSGDLTAARVRCAEEGIGC